jgi:hypothetical protein
MQNQYDRLPDRSMENFVLERLRGFPAVVPRQFPIDRHLGPIAGHGHDLTKL